MGLFRHPHLVRGIVHTSEGAFLIERGVAELPDDVGAALGWTPLEDEDAGLMSTPSPAPKRAASAGAHAAV